MMPVDWQLADWLDHIQRVHFRSIDLTLDRVRRVAHVLRLPEKSTTIVVAGTNGKGSSVSYLESIYAQAGYQTAAYSSPHLIRYNERVRIDGCPVPDELLIEAFEAVESARGQIPLTYFEFGTLAALWVFRQISPDIIILEVGMGGRLDAVNIVDADVALITEIGLDHQQWLGNSVDRIAREKAGILRHKGRAVSSGVRPPAALADIAGQKHCTLWQLGIDFGYETQGGSWNWLPLRERLLHISPEAGMPIPHGGQHQLNNAAGAIAVVRCLEDSLPVSKGAISEGLRHAVLPGRLQLLDGPPAMLLDVSHNADGLAALSDHLRQHPVAGRLLGVFSMLADKDIPAALREVGEVINSWYVGLIDNERAADPVDIQTVINDLFKAPVVLAASVTDALDLAISEACESDLVVVFGSFYAVGDIMRRCQIDPYPASR